MVLLRIGNSGGTINRSLLEIGPFSTHYRRIASQEQNILTLIK